METIIKNIDELDTYVFNFLDGLDLKDTATIIALSGDLGSGKTAFTKSAARYFNINQDITSPTFVIQKEYDIQHTDRFQKMIHIDAYRLEDKSELEYLKWHETIADPKTIIFLEWPEQVQGIDMPYVYHIYIEILDNEKRQITLD